MSMRCQDCGAPCASKAIVCPFCGFEVGLQRVSEIQRLILRWALPAVRVVVLLFFLLFLFRESLPLGLGITHCCGNIGG